MARSLPLPSCASLLCSQPKWLFPTGKHSRYKKHRVLKSQGQLTLEQWNALYDPLDLVSGDAERIHKATEALVQDWEGGGNNLRVFLGGQAVRDAKVSRGKIQIVNLVSQANTTCPPRLLHDSPRTSSGSSRDCIPSPPPISLLAASSSLVS